ncbi:MAG: peptidylprolyl isomerase, partial [Gemmatimonadota bacterium]
DEPRAAERGGLLEPGREGSWVPEFWAAAASLEEGEISPVVETEFGFHVIRLEERRAVPFDEARDRFLEQVVDLPEALGRATDWVTARQAEMAVDTSAVMRWRAGDDSVGVLVRWPDSLAIPAFGDGDLDDYIRSSSREDPVEVRGLEPAELMALVESATRTHILLARASTRGIEPSTSQRAGVRSHWQQQVARWATALGFREGLSRSEVKERALTSLGASAQSALVARSELPRVADRLHELYPVTYRAPEE